MATARSRRAAPGNHDVLGPARSTSAYPSNSAKSPHASAIRLARDVTRARSLKIAKLFTLRDLKRGRRCLHSRLGLSNPWGQFASFFDLAGTVVALRSLIRRAWTIHRWDNRPTRHP